MNRWTGEFSDNTLTMMSPTKKHRKDLNGSPLDYYSNQVQVRPRLLENGLIGNKDYDNLPENFKKIFSNDTKDQEMKLPVVGYGGHRKGYQSENMFAKNFRDSTLQAQKGKRYIKVNTRSYYVKS